MHDGLRRLDYFLGATFSGRQCDDLFGVDTAKELGTKGVLRSLGPAVRLAGCRCDQQLTDCTFRIGQKIDGGYEGLCNKAGEPFLVPDSDVWRYRFDPMQWAGHVRSANDLDGPEPIVRGGCLVIGDGMSHGRRYRLVVVSASSDPSLATRAFQSTDPSIYTIGCYLGNRSRLPELSTVVHCEDLFKSELFRLDDSAIDYALTRAGGAAVVAGTHPYRVYAHDAPKGRPLSESEYADLTSASKRMQHTVLVDLISMRAYFRGRLRDRVLDSDGKATTRKLGSVALQIVAEYLMKPDKALNAADLIGRKSSEYNPKSANNQRNAAVRSLGLKAYFEAVRGNDGPGTGGSIFVPRSLRYCVITSGA